MPTFLCKWAINVTLACEKHLFFLPTQASVEKRVSE